MKDNGGFEALWKNHLFTSCIASIVWDEAHCISKWGDFRPEYKDAGRLRYLIPKGIPFLITSATLPTLVLRDVKDILQSRETYTIHRSNDRPNVHIVIREMKYPLNGFLDLAFLIPDDWTSDDPPPPKFLIFFDSIAESIEAVNFLRGRLPLQYQDRIKWFNADMSPEFRADESHALKAGETWGLACTDSFGMVSTLYIVLDDY